MVAEGYGFGGVVEEFEDGDVEAVERGGAFAAGVGDGGPALTGDFYVGAEVEYVCDAEGLEGWYGAGGWGGGAVEEAGAGGFRR